MKQLLALLVLTTCLTATAIANNDNGTKKDNKGTTQTDPEKPVKEASYKFSIKKSYFNIFDLFSVEPAKVDTLGRKEDQEADSPKSIW